MTHALLIIVTWIQAGAPLISVTPLESTQQCQIAKRNAVAMVQAQAASNLVGAHAELHEERNGADVVTLRTRPTGREIARLQCVAAITASASLAPHRH